MTGALVLLFFEFWMGLVVTKLTLRLCSDTVLVKTLKVKTVAHHRGPVVKLKLTERLDTVVALRF